MASEFLFEKAFDKLEFFRLCAIEDNYSGTVFNLFTLMRFIAFIYFFLFSLYLFQDLYKGL